MHKVLFLAAGAVLVLAVALFVVRLRVLGRMRLCTPPEPVLDSGPYRDCAVNAEQVAACVPAKPKLWVLAGRVFPDPADPAWCRSGDDSYSFGQIHVYVPFGHVDVRRRTMAQGAAAKEYIAAVVACQAERWRSVEDAKFEEALAKLPLAPKEH